MHDLEKLPDIDKNDYKPLYVQLSDILIDYINSNDIQPNTLLPSEKDLMERYGISRPTVRLAFQRLEASNLVRRIRGKGTFLVDPVFGKHLYSMFHTPEERFAAEGISVKSVLLELSNVYPLKRQSEELHLSPKGKACLLRRLKLIEDKPFGIEERLIPLETSRRLKKDDLKQKSIFHLINSLPDHGINQISYSFKSRSVKKKEAKEMEVALGTPVLVRKGLYHTRDGKPVMLSQMIILPEILDFEFVVRKVKDSWLVVKSQ